MFDKVKLINFEKVKKVVALDDTYNFLTAGLQNVLLTVVEELSIPTLMLLF